MTRYQAKGEEEFELQDSLNQKAMKLKLSKYEEEILSTNKMHGTVHYSDMERRSASLITLSGEVTEEMVCCSNHIFY